MDIIVLRMFARLGVRRGPRLAYRNWQLHGSSPGEIEQNSYKRCSIHAS